MQVARASDFDSFREAARPLLRAGVRPEQLSWQDEVSAQSELFGSVGTDPTSEADPPNEHESPIGQLRVPRRFVELLRLAVLMRSADRFALAYRLLYRLRGEPRLMDDQLDRDVQELARRAKNVRADEHRMHAFVRFRRSALHAVDTFVAWYEPQHFIVRLTAPFFERRFASQRWSILTPDESAYWDGASLRFGPGIARAEAPRGDELEALFRTYYEATFNPARVNTALFRRHVPRSYQANMPELTSLSTLLHKEARKDEPVACARPPAVDNLSELREHARGCRACPLGEQATQTVFGAGPTTAKLCLVGEQPGDEEDRSGLPFVGPAGQLLDRALHEASLDRAHLYVTNAVKHFSFRLDGKKRLHVTPSYGAIKACKPWLEAELALLKPSVIVCLGASAAQSFLGRRFSVTQNRGRVFQLPWARSFLVTYHPSAVLRAGQAEAGALYSALVADLRRARELLA